MGLTTCGKFRDSQIEYIWVIACPGMEHGVQLFAKLLSSLSTTYLLSTVLELIQGFLPHTPLHTANHCSV